MGLPSLQEREEFIANELNQRGYSPPQIAAVMGSVAHESSFNPSIQEKGGTGLGLFQWSYDRRKKVPALTGDFYQDARNQINLFEQELSGSEKQAGEMLRSAKDLPSAAAAMKQFERYGVAGNRYKYMDEYAKRLGQGELLGSQGGSGQSADTGSSFDVMARIGGKPSGGDGLAAVATAGLGLSGSLGLAGGDRFAGSAPFVAAIQALGGRKQQPQVGTALTANPLASSSASSAEDGGALGLGEFGKKLQQAGFKVAENPLFGGVGKHSPNSHHYSGDAFDLTIQPGSPLLKGRPDSDWKALTAKYGEELRKALPGAEIFHPGHDPVGGHDSHIHLAIPGGSKSGVRMNQRLQQLLAMAG